MPRFEYKVVPAPARGLKVKGVKRPEERFALALSTVMNELGADGWDYVRADILPAEERTGLTSKQTVYHSLLVFRRQVADAADAPAPDRSEEDVPLALAAPVDADVAEPSATTDATPEDQEAAEESGIEEAEGTREDPQGTARE